MLEIIRDMMKLRVQKRRLRAVERQIEKTNRAIGMVTVQRKCAMQQREKLEKMIEAYNAQYEDGLAVKEERA